MVNGLRARWDGLPRDTRDTFFVLGLIAWTVAPHLARLPVGVGLLCAGVLAWRAVLAWRDAALPGRWPLLAVLLLAAGLTWWDQHTLLGREAGITLLVVLMALKTLELRARRDALVVFFLGFFLVLTQFLYSQSLLSAAAMLLSVWGWLTALTLAHMPAGRPPLREAAGTALRAALLGLPVMLALFLLFPRIPPLWSMPGDGARTGLSDHLRLGDVAELAQDNSVALRLRFEGPAPPLSQLYLRGPVLSRYDGQSWQADPWPRRAPAPQPAAAPSAPAGGLGYEMTLEPLRIAWLPLLDYATTPPRAEPPLDGLRAPDDDSLQWRLRSPLGERTRLLATAAPRRPDGGILPRWDRLQLTSLPPGRHPRTRAWARALATQPGLLHADAQTLAQAVLRHLREDGYAYTLSPGPYEGDAIDEFWMDRKLGFCEHYASAFVVVMRSLGVPARIVTGYQGTDPTPVDGHWVVRQSNAHAWAEYWQEGQGWLRADPTAAVAPDRILRSTALRPPPGLVMDTLDSMSPGLRLQLRRWLETWDNRWNQWVLGYGRQQQFQLLRDWGWPEVDAAALARLLVLCLSGLGLAGAAWAWWDGRRQAPWPRLQRRLARRLARWGVTLAPADSPAALARRLAERHGENVAPMVAALQALQRQRYAPGPAPATLSTWWRTFQAAERRCAPPRRP
ncbi:transglutaminaseTgpA domain-containing protein [Ideonella oryzae]|uniref:DUF3488 and transglutaminase-like domain-containing protein n=1 Tax=Ideonella oryzae TaxID=2937441 RepID=A0ABT1BK47_9BURK|nr:DUF3488 and transglutaminase-like domain-containing protein [Ideonella oryzae]MCO5976578.1 DUF3488 and transglutaminase-like domain-containing protein [Ideonella oryzae]